MLEQLTEARRVLRVFLDRVLAQSVGGEEQQLAAVAPVVVVVAVAAALGLRADERDRQRPRCGDRDHGSDEPLRFQDPHPNPLIPELPVRRANHTPAVTPCQLLFTATSKVIPAFRRRSISGIPSAVAGVSTPARGGSSSSASDNAVSPIITAVAA